MMVLALVVMSALVGGFAAVAAMARWPSSDPGAPHVDADRTSVEVSRHPRLAGIVRARLDPRTATGLLLTLAVVLLTLGIGFAGLLLVMVQTHSGFARFDAGAARFGAAHATGSSTAVLRLLTQLGGAVVLVPLGVAVAVMGARRSRPVVAALFLGVCVLGQFLVANGVKSLVSRARPEVLHLTGYSGSSFPSGHAAAAAASFAGFALVLGRGRTRPVRRALTGVAVGLAIAIAATRVFLGVHWLTDVLAGLAIGWAWFAACSIAFGGRLLRFGEPVEVAEALVQDAR